jgi:hypothetical protein
MAEAKKDNGRGRAEQHPARERLYDQAIQDGFDLLHLGHLGQEPFATPNEFAGSFERCSILKKGRIRIATSTGV